MIPQALRFRDRLLANTRPRIVETRDHVCAGPPQRGLMCFTKKAFMLPFRKRQFARLIVVNKATAKKGVVIGRSAAVVPCVVPAVPASTGGGG